MPTTASEPRRGRMQLATTVPDTRRSVAAARASGARVAFVPTMGFLHEGHLQLVDEARRRADFVVMSIFVNPLQFGPTEDFARYPRDAEGDAAKASARGVSLLFAPGAGEMYSGRRVVGVAAEGLDRRWEGEIRPGHFTGVLTVVAKLFNIVQPDLAVFGQKDFQQAALVRAMVRDLDFALELEVVRTVRESDGLAMSSRNSFLSPVERERARALSAALREIEARFAEGVRGAETLLATGRRVLGSSARIAVDYLAVVDSERLEPVSEAKAGDVVLLAARVGATRLLDNVVLGA